MGRAFWPEELRGQGHYHFSFHKTVILRDFTARHSLSQTGLAEIKCTLELGRWRLMATHLPPWGSLLLTVWFLRLRKWNARVCGHLIQAAWSGLTADLILHKEKPGVQLKDGYGRVRSRISSPGSNGHGGGNVPTIVSSPQTWYRFHSQLHRHESKGQRKAPCTGLSPDLAEQVASYAAVASAQFWRPQCPGLAPFFLTL